jgi:hypothetical protein
MTPAKVPFSSLHLSPNLARHRLLLAAVAVVASLWALPRLAPAFAAAATGGASLHVLAVADTGSGNRHQMVVAQQMALVNRRHIRSCWPTRCLFLRCSAITTSAPAMARVR